MSLTSLTTEARLSNEGFKNGICPRNLTWQELESLIGENALHILGSKTLSHTHTRCLSFRF